MHFESAYSIHNFSETQTRSLKNTDRDMKPVYRLQKIININSMSSHFFSNFCTYAMGKNYRRK